MFPDSSSQLASRCRMGSAKSTIRRYATSSCRKTFFFGLQHAGSVVVACVADYNAHGTHLALVYKSTAAYAAQLAAMGDQLQATAAIRRSPIAPPAQAGHCHSPALVSHGRMSRGRAHHATLSAIEQYDPARYPNAEGAIQPRQTRRHHLVGHMSSRN